MKSCRKEKKTLIPRKRDSGACPRKLKSNFEDKMNIRFVLTTGKLPVNKTEIGKKACFGRRGGK